MSKQILHIIPFEKLLHQLRKDDGVRISIDTYQKLNRLLNHWQENDGEDDLNRLKVQMGVLIAHSPEEQARFYERFEAYVRDYTYNPPEKKESHKQRRRLQWAFGIAVVSFTLSMLGLLLSSIKGIGPKVAWQQSAFDYTVWIEDQSIAKQPFRTIKGEITQKWEIYRDSSLITKKEGREIRIDLTEAGSYQAKLYLQNEEIRDSLIFPFEVVEPWIPTISKRLYEEGRVIMGFTLVEGRIHTDSTLSKKAQSQISIYEDRFPEEPTESFLWQTGDGATLSTDKLDYTYDTDGRYDVSLYYQGNWIAESGEVLFSLTDTVRERILIEREEQNQDKPEIPALGIELKEVDISKLIKQEIPPWIWWASGLILGLWLIYESYLFVFGKVVLDAARMKGPPLKKKLEIDRPDVSLFTYQAFEELVMSMREKKQAEASILDVDASLKDTLEKGGIAELIWKKRKQSVPYLILIEQKSGKDQLALHLKEWAEALAERDITVEIRFFKGELGFFRKSMGIWEPEESLARLAASYSRYRLIIISEGDAFFDSLSGALSEPALQLKKWPVKTLLSTRPVNSWDVQEHILQSVLPIFPFNQKGIQSYPTIWQDEGEVLPLRYWLRNTPEVPLPKLDKEDWVEAVREYLGPKGFMWLCLLAIYPELHRHFILHYGHELGFIPEKGRTLSEEGDEIMCRLLRLPWIRKGRLPDSVRLALYQELENMGSKGKQAAKEARTYLIALLKREENQAPPDSWALEEQQASLAIYTFQNSERDAKAVKQLKEQLANIQPDKIKDVVSLQRLREAGKNPLALVLPRNAFKHEIPLFGIKTGVRALLALIPLAILWLVYYSLFHSSEIPAEPRVDQLYQNTATEKGMWEAYQGVKAFNSDQFQQAGIYFEEATDLLEENELPELSTNLAAARFEYGRVLYETDSIDQVLNIFTDCCNASLVKDGTYAQGISRLSLESVGEGVENLLSLDSLYYQDSSQLYLRSENPQILPNVLKRVYGVQNETTQTQIDRLLRWMGTEISDLNQLLLDAQRAVDRGEDSLAVILYRRVMNESRPEEPYYQQAERELAVPLDKLQPRIRALLQEAERLIEQGDNESLNSAEGLYNLVISWEPGNVAAGEGLARIENKGNKPQPPFIPTDTLKQRPGKDGVEPTTIDKDTMLTDTSKSDLDPGPLPKVIPPKMIFIKGGRFTMGSKSFLGMGKGFRDERPAHTVTLSDFYLAETEVTNAQFVAFLNAKGNQEEGGVSWYNESGSGYNGYAKAYISQNNSGDWVVDAGKENYPVNHVSWYGAVAYCKWLGAKYRLPTEAEWEYAAGGGESGRTEYSGTNSLDELRSYGNYDGTGGQDIYAGLAPVKSFAKIRLNLYDMSGNLWEWCQDWYGSYPSGPQTNPQGPTKGVVRVLRGGSWSVNASGLRVAFRNGSSPSYGVYLYGFRPARTP